MNDPKRLLDDNGASQAASLLRAMQRAEPPSAAKEAELVRRMMTPVAAPVPHAAGSSAATWTVAGAALLACGLAVSWFMLRDGGSSTQPSVRPALVVPSVAPVRQPEPVVPPQAPEAVARPGVVAPPSATVSSKSTARDTLAEEEALLEQARQKLAASPAGALSLLRQHQQRFPTGQLTAERMFLSVDALRRVGDRAGAERQTQALLKRFPSSVYASQLLRQAAP